ncbi:MAG: hypothetical protein MAG451_01763 [Anaerolineales bacterium]|nr:hypothetical protein [Anaerolineales bacterium]
MVRWPQGVQNSIDLPPHPNCRIDESDIVATFHIHPNTGIDYLQEPSETDKGIPEFKTSQKPKGFQGKQAVFGRFISLEVPKRAVRDDPDLKGAFYVGEFVISRASIYVIAPDGRVSEVGETQALLTEG